jgi:Flp pilus assembly pilin Flp
MAAIIDFLYDESGATGVEYTLIAALVFLAMISGVAALGQSLESLFNYAGSELVNAMQGAANAGASTP